ncbi:MAG TPA: nucleotidyltransferase family protein [Terriglobales bacterium]|nr:nucleotidyltransferase family protein [Terriglobales bacterium]
MSVVYPDHASRSYAAVILAAGTSTRMGKDKALLDWYGKTFLTATIESLTPFSQLVIVVGGENSESLKPSVWAQSAYLVTNPRPQLGQFSSLQIGLQEVLNRGRDAAIITHVDRPPASPGTIQALQVAFGSAANTGKWAVVPQFGGKHGHPIVVGREMMEAFLKSDPTTTARDVEHANQERIVYLPIDDPNVVTNVNTPEEYAALVSSFSPTTPS